MSNKQAVKLPPKLLLASFVGTILAGFGLAEVFAKTNLTPPQWQFENYGWFMIIVGCLLTVPHSISLFKKARTTDKDKNV